MESLQSYFVKYSEYFEDIRHRFLFLVKLFLCVFFVVFFVTTPSIKLWLTHFSIKDVVIVTTSPFQLLDVSMSIAMFFALIVVTPFLIYHVYAFLKPGLLKRERRIFMLLIPVSLVLFCVGFSYGFLTLYYATEAIAQINVSIGIVNYWDIGKFFSQIIFSASLLGLLFEFPLIITFLIRSGFVAVDFLRSKRRHAIAIIFLFVSLLPPTDGISLILMATPMVFIYELTILLNSRIGYRRKAIIK